MAREMRKVRNFETPAISRGAITTIPSGTFCSAIPKLTAQAELLSAALNPTPAAIPSGNLCKAMARTKSSTRFSEALLRCSSSSSPVSLCRCGVSRSSTFRNSIPAMTPASTSHHRPIPASSAAGTISPTVDAASITPAQKPSTASFHLCGSDLMKNPKTDPMTVARQSPAALIQT